MTSLRAIIRFSVAVAIVLSYLGASPRSSGQAPDLQKKLEARYALTKPTDDKSDIVTAGAILILQKDKLLMYPTSTQVPPQNTYKDGKLASGAYGLHDRVKRLGFFLVIPA